MAKPASYWQDRAAFYAKQAGVPADIFTRQIKFESGFRPDARSGAGAVGIAQIVPKYHPSVNPNDPEASLAYAAKMDASNYRKYHNWKDVLSVYNSGRPWSRGQKFSETNKYVTGILGGLKTKRGLGPSTPPAASPGASTQIGGSAVSRLDTSWLLQRSMDLAAGKTDSGGLLGWANARAALSGAMVNPGGTSEPSPLPTSGEKPVMKGAEASVIEAIRQAQRFGLHVSENPLVDKVDPVHVSDSYHYRTFPQAYMGKKVGEAFDSSGSAKQMAQFYKWAARRYRNVSELFYDPLGGIKNGKPIGAIGGHSDHVHFAFGP